MTRSAWDEIASAQEETPDVEAPAAPRGRRSRRRERRHSPLRHVLPALLVIIVLVGLGAGGVYGYRWATGTEIFAASEPDDYEGSGTGEVVIEVQEGDTGTDIAETLVENDVILATGPFVTIFSNNPDAATITPGSYRLKEQMSSAAALELLLDPSSMAGIRVTIPEGLRASTVFERVSEQTGIPVEDFEAAAEDPESIGVPDNPADSVEGYLWPGQYDIPEDATADDVLTMMTSRMKAELEERGIPRDEWHRVLTIASIAEKEARTPEDYGRVSRTIENRLAGTGEAGGQPMLLQLDSTVAYVSGRKSVSTTPAERAVDSPYNTYKNAGLPIGPISNPGAATIDAVLDPPPGDWLYWVTVNTDTGETKFAETKAEHDVNVSEWRRWAAAKDG